MGLQIESDADELLSPAFASGDIGSILEILPLETREPLEAAMAAAVTASEKFEILRSNLPTMISFAPKRKRPKLAAKPKHKMDVENESDIDLKSQKEPEQSPPIVNVKAIGNYKSKPSQLVMDI